MPAERVAMCQAREIIRLKFSAGLPTREIARRLGVAASTVRGTLRRFGGGGLGWPLPNGMSDGDLEAALYANHGTKRGHRRHAEPDWPTVHRELKRKHVTLVIVWDEYIAANPGGYSYSRFCELYRGFEIEVVADDAADACGWRAAVRRLCRRWGSCRHRPANRRNPQGANLCRRARRIELHFLGPIRLGERRCCARDPVPRCAPRCAPRCDRRPRPRCVLMARPHGGFAPTARAPALASNPKSLKWNRRHRSTSSATAAPPRRLQQVRLQQVEQVALHHAAPLACA